MKTIILSLVILLSVIILTSCGDSSTKVNEETKKTTVEKQKSIWETVELTDKFGDPSGSTAITAVIKGKFSNSATQDAKLITQLSIQDSTIYTYFFEYETNRASTPKKSTVVWINVKLGNGKVIEMEQYLYGDKMVDCKNAMLNLLLSENKPVKVIVDMSNADKYNNAVYEYTIDPYGLKATL